jgi:hypothetical protein
MRESDVLPYEHSYIRTGFRLYHNFSTVHNFLAPSTAASKAYGLACQLYKIKELTVFCPIEDCKDRVVAAGELSVRLQT